MTNQIRKTFLALLPLGVLFLSLLLPHAARAGVMRAQEALTNAALPSLFPALVLSGFAVRLLSGRGGGARFAFFLGLICGFPVGAITVAELYQNGKISKKQAEHLSVCCNNASPAFLMGVCSFVLKDERAGTALFTMQALFCFLYFTFFCRKRGSDCPVIESEYKAEKDVLSCFLESVSQGMKSFLFLSAYVLFFGFLAELLSALLSLSGTAKAALTLLLELTSGVDALSCLPARLAFCLCAFGCGFGGICVQLQTFEVLSKSRLSFARFLIGKTVIGVLMLLSAVLISA